MKAQTVDVRESAGRILCCTIFRPSGRKLLGKGHVLNEEDVRLLEMEGLGQVWVTELEDGEIGEDEEDDEGVETQAENILKTQLADDGDGAQKEKALHPRDIDAFWLQRELKKVYTNELDSQKKTAEVLEILKVGTFSNIMVLLSLYLRILELFR